MLSQRNEILVGLGVMALSALALWWLIPAYVALPKRPPMMALAPSFWPKIICWIMMLCGVLLTVKAIVTAPPPEVFVERPLPGKAGALRLAALFVMLTIAYFALPVVGMVWICMVLFVLLAFMAGGTHPVWNIAVGLALPLLLYFFFSKVAGVAIPQGQFVRLP